MILKKLYIVFLLIALVPGIAVCQNGVYSGAGNGMSESEMDEFRQKINLDYSMPDFSTSKIDSRVMGNRLSQILSYIDDHCTDPANLCFLNSIQTDQVENLSYARIKKMRLAGVSKKGNEITIRYRTSLEPNNLGLKDSEMVFDFIDGISNSRTVNEFFSTECRYIRESFDMS